MKLINLLEDNTNDRESMFQKAKSIALRVAKTSGRSDKSIKKSQDVSDLENAVSGWKNAKDSKLKTGFKNIVNTLKKKPNQEENNNDKKQSKEDSSTDINKEIEVATKNLDPERSKNYEMAVKQEQNDIERISDTLNKNIEKRKASAEHINELIKSLLELIAPDAKISGLDVSDSADKKIEQINNLNDTIDEVNSYKDDIEKDFDDKIKAQETMLKNVENKYKNRNCPEVDEYENKRKDKIKEELEDEIYKNPSLKLDYDNYMHLAKNEMWLSDDERKELEKLKSSKIGQIIKTINDKNKPLSKDEIKEKNLRWFKEQTAETRAEYEANVAELKAKLNSAKAAFYDKSKNIVKLLQKRKETLESGKLITDEDDDNVRNNLKELSNVMKDVMKKLDENGSEDDDVE